MKNTQKTALLTKVNLRYVQKISGLSVPTMVYYVLLLISRSGPCNYLWLKPQDGVTVILQIFLVVKKIQSDKICIKIFLAFKVSLLECSLKHLASKPPYVFIKNMCIWVRHLNKNILRSLIEMFSKMEKYISK